jgi:hypothetical protein
MDCRFFRICDLLQFHFTGRHMRNGNPLVLGRFQDELSTGTAGLVDSFEVTERYHATTMQASHPGHSSSYLSVGLQHSGQQMV